MKIITLPLADIDVGIRLRPVDDDHAAEIGASMTAFGQRAPIEVLPRQASTGLYPLIAGAHRLRGATIEGMTAILAVVRDVDDLTAEVMEIDENLSRHELNALDRAVFMARRKDIYLNLHPEVKAGGNRKGDQIRKHADLIQTFSAATAERLGISESTIDRAVARANGLSDATKKLIGTTWIARRASHLDAISKLVSEDQLAVVNLLLAHGAVGEMLTVGAAIRLIKQTPTTRTDVVDADFQKLRRLFERSDVGAQQRFREHLSQMAREAARQGRAA